MIEIRWHGRGGQGAKTVAEFLALVAINEGKYSQGFPEYGPERSGAPIKGYTRISSGPIRMHSAIYRPDIVLVLDASLLGMAEAQEGIRPGGVVIVNSPDDPAQILAEHPYLGDQKLWVVDADRISTEEFGRAMPNMPLLGVLVKAAEVVDLAAVIKNIRTEFSRRFSPRVLEGNIRAVERAHQEATAV